MLVFLGGISSVFWSLLVFFAYHFPPLTSTLRECLGPRLGFRDLAAMATDDNGLETFGYPKHSSNITFYETIGSLHIVYLVPGEDSERLHHLFSGISVSGFSGHKI